MTEFTDAPKPKPEEEQEVIIEIDPLPTTPEIALQGTQDFEAVSYEIQEYELLDRYLLSKKIRTCFTGITPEISDVLNIVQYKYDYGDNWEEQYEKDRGALIHAVNKVTENFVFFEYPFIGEDEQTYYLLAMINLEAVERVLEQNTDIFPSEASSSPAEWLVKNIDQWEDRDSPENSARYGLLSGFPRRSTRNYQVYYDIFSRIRDQYGSEEMKFFMDYKNGDIERSEENKHKLQKLAGNIDSETMEAIAEFTGMHSELMHLGFVSFDPSHDKQYVQRLEAIYLGSGIEETARRLYNETFYTGEYDDGERQ